MVFEFNFGLKLVTIALVISSLLWFHGMFLTHQQEQNGIAFLLYYTFFHVLVLWLVSFSVFHVLSLKFLMTWHSSAGIIGLFLTFLLFWKNGKYLSIKDLDGMPRMCKSNFLFTNGRQLNLLGYLGYLCKILCTLSFFSTVSALPTDGATLFLFCVHSFLIALIQS